MQRIAFITAVLSVLAAPVAHGQIDACPRAVVPIPAQGPIGTKVPAPNGHTKFMLVDKSGQPTRTPNLEVSLGGSQEWNPTVEQANMIREQAAAVGQGRLPLRLRWEGGNGGQTPPCDMVVSLDPLEAPPVVGQVPGRARVRVIADADQDPFQQTYQEDECAKAGAALEEHIRRQRRAQGKQSPDAFTEIVFFEGVGVCYPNRDYGVEGDPIHVAVFTDNPELWNGITATFDPCAAESEAPKIRVTGELPRTLSGAQAGEFRLRGYQPRRCFNTNVDITVTSQPDRDGNQQIARHNLTQAERFRASYQAGVNFTPLHDRTFGLRPSNEGNRIFDKGPEEEGPEYFASLIFYSVLKYLPSLAGGEPYPGRDVVHDQDLFDRLGLIMGVGIRNPLDRFVVGGSFDIIPGISVTRTYEFAKVKTLDGVGVGDVFTGTEQTIPVRAKWQRGWATGVAIDLRYVARLFPGS